MSHDHNNTSINLFYSYAHCDKTYQQSMKRELTRLQKAKIINQWSDRNITPGEHIWSEIQNAMDRADMAVFLFSPAFFQSSSCRREWKYLQEKSKQGSPVVRIPIIIRDCNWEEFLGEDGIKVLPDDGKPITSFDNEDNAWQQVFDGIKAAAHKLQDTFRPTKLFLQKISTTNFIGNEYLTLDDIFIFPQLTCIDAKHGDQEFSDTTISTRQELLEFEYTLVYGQERSGKTALARHLYLSLINAGTPSLLLEDEHIQGRYEYLFERTYNAQYKGVFSDWHASSDKILIVDVSTTKPQMLKLIALAKKEFSRIVLILSSEYYYAFFAGEPAFANFRHMRIDPLTSNQQAELIRKRLDFSNDGVVQDGMIDQAEERVNSIIISDRIVPRYPFYILSILQTYEAFMPSNLAITSYGHCYLALITANLVRSGVSSKDDEINACFNFAEQLAFSIYCDSTDESDARFQFETFVGHYDQRFHIRRSTINKLKRQPYGIIDEDGSFRTKYMYYFFLGKFLANNPKEGEPIIASMCQDSHREVNYLTLLFVIHHTHDTSIIDDIVIRTMCTLDSFPEAQLDPNETRKFSTLVEQLPEDIQSYKSVEEEREQQRDRRDGAAADTAAAQEGADETDDMELVNGIYKIMKNNRIMGQVLRTKHGNLEKSTIQEIVGAIADSGLRLVNLLLQDQEEITQLAVYIKSKCPDWDLAHIKLGLEYLSFCWTMGHIEAVVAAINVPEIQESIETVVRQRSTPAYDLIGYFSLLDGAIELKELQRDALVRLLKTHKDGFIRRILSLRTQHYMNTRRSRARIEQSICQYLQIEYRARPIKMSNRLTQM